MLIRLSPALLSNQAPEGNPGGAGGAPPAGAGGAPPAGGGAPPPAGGGDPLFGDPGAGGGGNPPPANPPAGTPPAGNPPPGVSIPQNWKEALPKEMQELPFMKNVTDLPTLVKNYENAQKMVGADKMVIPGKSATPEQWKEVFKKLGVPEKVEDYKYELDKTTRIDKDFEEAFKKHAIEVGMLPSQVGKSLDFFSKINDQVWENMQKEKTIAQNEAIKNLKTEFGQAYEGEIVKARSAVLEFTTEEERKAIQESGMGKDPAFIRLMAKVGATLAEDKIRGSGGGMGSGALTPAQALAKIEEVKANPHHPYWKVDHPEHATAKKEYTSYFAMAFPEKKS